LKSSDVCVNTQSIKVTPSGPLPYEPHCVWGAAQVGVVSRSADEVEAGMPWYAAASRSTLPSRSLHLRSMAVAQKVQQDSFEKTMAVSLSLKETHGGLAESLLHQDYSSCPLPNPKPCFFDSDGGELPESHPTSASLANSPSEYDAASNAIVDRCQQRLVLAGDSTEPCESLPTTQPPPRSGGKGLIVDDNLCELTSIGSALHALGKCRPCTFAWSERGCVNGATCRFCHFRHVDGGKRVRPCKSKRMAFKKLIENMEFVLEQPPSDRQPKTRALVPRIGAEPARTSSPRCGQTSATRMLSTARGTIDQAEASAQRAANPLLYVTSMQCSQTPSIGQSLADQESGLQIVQRWSL